jgi:glycosyltransferase involved in cell wall biosynthesis
MKILYVITGLAQGGAERVVCDLADKMYEKGNEVKIAYLTGEILTSPTHKEIELTKVNLNNIASLPKAYLVLSRLIKNYHPDVVHSHMVHANLFTRLIRLVVPINKLISTAHSSNEGGQLRMRLYRATHNLADLTTNVSNTAVTAFEEKKAVPKSSMKTVYNGVDFNKFSYSSMARQEIAEEFSLNHKCKVILAVGRFSQPKNYPNLLNAIKLLKDSLNSPFILLVAGDGELRSEIEAQIDKLGLINKVILLGRRNDINKLMSACDVFVLSSDYEGLPTVLIEAMACQAHVVSTDVSGVREIVSKFGKIVPVKQPAVLANALKEVLFDIDQSKNVLGFNHVKSIFDLHIISDKWLEIYNAK